MGRRSAEASLGAHSDASPYSRGIGVSRVAGANRPRLCYLPRLTGECRLSSDRMFAGQVPNRPIAIARIGLLSGVST